MKSYDKVFIDGRWQACPSDTIEVFEAGTG